MSWFGKGQSAQGNGKTSVPPKGLTQQQENEFRNGHAAGEKKAAEQQSGGKNGK